MVDTRASATLRGFSVSVADIGDRMDLCPPLLSFEGDPTLYFAHRLDWRNDPEALAIADPSEAAALGTLLPPTCMRPIVSGEGVVAMGAGLARAAEAVGVAPRDSEISLAPVDDAGCWIGVATPALYTALRTGLVEAARTAFDEALEEAVHRGSRLSERGHAALLLMRTCGPLRRDDLAIRQLAAARQERNFDLYRRLSIRFAFELGTQKSILDGHVEQYITMVADREDDIERQSHKDWILVSLPAGYPLMVGKKLMLIREEFFQFWQEAMEVTYKLRRKRVLSIQDHSTSYYNYSPKAIRKGLNMPIGGMKKIEDERVKTGVSHPTAS